MSVGAWRSQVARSVRDAEVGGSNPLAPTIITSVGAGQDIVSPGRAPATRRDKARSGLAAQPRYGCPGKGSGPAFMLFRGFAIARTHLAPLHQSTRARSASSGCAVQQPSLEIPNVRLTIRPPPRFDRRTTADGIPLWAESICENAAIHIVDDEIALGASSSRRHWAAIRNERTLSPHQPYSGGPASVVSYQANSHRGVVIRHGVNGLDVDRDLIIRRPALSHSLEVVAHPSSNACDGHSWTEASGNRSLIPVGPRGLPRDHHSEDQERCGHRHEGPAQKKRSSPGLRQIEREIGQMLNVRFGGLNPSQPQAELPFDFGIAIEAHVIHHPSLPGAAPRHSGPATSPSPQARRGREPPAHSSDPSGSAGRVTACLAP